MKLVIITVCYNDLKGLNATLESLYEYQNSIIKHIIIDGNSNDGTKDFLNTLSLPWNFEYVSEKDFGIFDAMNKGVRKLIQSQFDCDYKTYVWFLNSGDKALKFDIIKIKSDKQLIFFKSIQSSPLYPNFTTIRPDINSHFAFEKWILYNTPVHQAVLFNCNILNELIYDLSFKNQADTKLIFELILRHQYEFINTLICNFELGGNSGLYSKKSKVINQLSEEIFVRNILINRSFISFYFKIIIFQIKYLLNNILGNKYFHLFHIQILKIKYLFQKKILS